MRRVARTNSTVGLEADGGLARNHRAAVFVAALVASAACFSLVPGDTLGGSLVQGAALAALALAAVGASNPRALRAPRLGSAGGLGPWAWYVVAIGLAAGVASFFALPQGAVLDVAPLHVAQVVALCLVTGVFEEGVFRVLALDALVPALGGSRRGMLRAALVAMSVGLIASGVLAVMGAPGSLVSGCLFFTGYACFDLLIWTIIVMLSYKSGTSLLRIICVVYAVDQLGILLGTVLGLFVDKDGATIVSYIVFGSALLLLTVGLSGGKGSVWDSLSKYEIDFNRPDDASLRATGDDGAAPGLPPQRIAELSSRFFLTSRETDVLSLLVAGRNGPYISEHLHVSENTVKSHIRHIYTKVNVHNRQELLDLVFPQQP